MKRQLEAFEHEVSSWSAFSEIRGVKFGIGFRDSKGGPSSKLNPVI